MKKLNTFLISIAVFIAINISKAQVSDNVDTELPTSIAIQPQDYINSPAGALSNPVTINGFDNFALGVDFGEPHIATNPRDPLNSICAFNINNYYYTLNGFDWTKINANFPGFAVIGDPVMAFDSLGNAYYTQLYQNGGLYGICINKSTNKGVSFTATYNVASTSVGLSDKEWIAADQTAGPYSNNLYIGWRQFGASGMRVVSSSNQGANWSTPQAFIGGQGAYLAVGANGNVQGGNVYFAALSGGAIIVNRSTDGGQNFSPQEVAVTFVQGGVPCAGRNTVKSCIRMNGFPRMAADNSYTSSRGYVYIVYARNPGTADVTDINLVRSTDYGITWSAPVKVNDDLTTTDQWDPAISVDSKTGKVFISWFDSREDPTNNLLTKVYGTVSTNGGVSFTPNTAVSNAPFNPNNMSVGQPGGERYIGDYFGNSAIGNTSYVVWMDGRNNNLGSYTGYYPDFAMTTNTSSVNLGINDSAKIVVKVPAVNGPFIQRVRFTAVLDTLPTSGSINFSFQNGKDSISAFPDSVTLVIRAIGSVPARGYYLRITGKGTTGPPVHIRNANLLVNSSYVTVGTNRPGIAEFKINGVTYNQQQQQIFANGSSVTVQAISPRTLGATQYYFANWSNGGDTTQTLTVNGNLNLTAFYKTRYRLGMVSSQGTTFGGNIFYDSASSATFGVTSRIVNNGGTFYYFRGWTGVGTGSYTSSDSSGIDSAVIIPITAPVVETARWTTTVGIINTSSEIPSDYDLFQNYPNPFNPVTKIKFDIPQDARGETRDVKIVIYNALGKEVTTLVNERLLPGSYEVDFDASNLPSGLYFYRIEAGEFSKIKKMIFIK